MSARMHRTQCERPGSMRLSSIKTYLRKQRILARKSTFSAAFASALAPYDTFDTEAVAAAIRDLGQDPSSDLECVYCGTAAATWDHVNRRVVAGEYSGFGHRVRNLVPCCRTCNERKSSKTWDEWLSLLSPPDIEQRRRNMERFLSRPSATPFTIEDMRRSEPEAMAEFLEIRQEVFRLLKRADELADVLRLSAVRSHMDH